MLGYSAFIVARDTPDLPERRASERGPREFVWTPEQRAVYREIATSLDWRAARDEVIATVMATWDDEAA